MRSTMVSWHLRGHEGPTLTYGVYWGNDLYHPWDAMIPLTNEIVNVLVTTMGIWLWFMTFRQWGNCFVQVVLVYCVGCEHVNSHSLWWWEIVYRCIVSKELVNSLKSNLLCCYACDCTWHVWSCLCDAKKFPDSIVWSLVPRHATTT